MSTMARTLMLLIAALVAANVLCLLLAAVLINNESCGAVTRIERTSRHAIVTRRPTRCR